MSEWALLGLVVVLVLAAGLALLLTRRGGEPSEDVSSTALDTGQAAPRRTVAELVREREQQGMRTVTGPEPVTPTGPEGAEPGGPAPEPLDPAEPPLPEDDLVLPEAAGETDRAGEAAPGSSEPRFEPPRPGVVPVDSGPVGPPWNRGFVDGVPVEAPRPAAVPRPQPERRSAVDPALVARVTSVQPPEPAGRSDEPVVPGYVSPAVAEAVARAEAAHRASADEASGAEISGHGAPAAPVAEPPVRPVLSLVHSAQSTAMALAPRPTGSPDVEPSADESRTDYSIEESSPDNATVADLPAAELTDAVLTDAVAPSSVEESVSGAAEVSPAAADSSAVVAAEETAELVGPEPVEEPVAVDEAEQPVDAGLPDAPGAEAGLPADDAGGEEIIYSADLAEAERVEDLTRTDEPARTAEADDRGDSVADGAAARAAARAAEHAAVDLALLRTLGFADPNPRPGAAPVVDMSVDHSGEEDEPVDEALAVPVHFRVWGRERVAVPDPAATLLDARGRTTARSTGDGAGSGTVVAPRPGNFVLVASGTGYQPGVVALTVGEEPVDVDVQLTRSSSVSGSVSANGPRPAAVTLLQDGEVLATAEVDVAGAYRFADLAAGEYTVVAVVPGVPGAGPVATVVRLGEEQDEVRDLTVPSVRASMTG